MRYDTLDCPEFREGVIEAVCQRYGFKPAKPQTRKVIRPLFTILADPDDRERYPEEHYPNISSANESVTDRKPTPEDFQMVNNLIMFVRAKNGMRGNRNAARKAN